MSGYTRRHFLRQSGAGLASLLLGSRLLRAQDGEKKLNFIFFLIDDMGWMDTGCYGSGVYDTPNIDKLAASGMRFTDAYAACPVCSPTRASIITGKYPVRLGITNWGTKPVPLEEHTIAEALKRDGYTTFFAGKWHLGGKPAFWPEKQGFDINKGGNGSGQPRGGYFSPYNNPRLEDGPKGEYLTERLTDESVKFLKEHKDEPFLLYLSHYAVHTPLQAKKDAVARCKKKIGDQPKHDGPARRPEGPKATTSLVQDNAVYAAMVKSVDDSVGRVMEQVKGLGLEERTVVFFMSDNGGLSTLLNDRGLSKHPPTSNVPLRAGKGWLYEGGIREPMIVKWPGVVKAGSTCSEPVVSTDFYPTILEMAQLPFQPKQHVDGMSLAPLLKGKKKLPRPALFWHYPHHHGSGSVPSAAVRMRDYKLIEFFEDNRIELYNLKQDLSEQKDLAAAMPEKVRELRRLMTLWRMDVGIKEGVEPAEFSLFDGESLGLWRVGDFYSPGKVYVKEKAIHLEKGNDLTGITWTGPVPRWDYEVSLQAKRVTGYDFFCGLTFSVGLDPCTFVVGGWGGQVVGLSNIDYFDAMNNETARAKEFELNKWYRIRVRVTREKIEAWIDDEQMVDLKIEGRTIDIRLEVEPSVPLGMASWQTGAAVKDIRLKTF